MKQGYNKYVLYISKILKDWNFQGLALNNFYVILIFEVMHLDVSITTVTIILPYVSIAM